MATTRKQRIIRALTPKRVKRAQDRWRRRTKKVANARAKVRSVWHGDVVVNGRRSNRKKKPTPQKAAQKPAAARSTAKPVPPKKVALPKRPACDGTCTNSDMEPDDATAQGLCGMCCGRKELVTNFGNKHVHVRCGECDGSGLASVAALRKAQKHGGGTHGREANAANRPSRNEAAQKATPWVGLGSVLMALFTVFGLSFWFAAVGFGVMAIGAAAYRHHRKHGVPERGASTDRKAARQAAREAGCSAACMWSIKPADTCHCPCGGTTHGTAHKRKAAA